MSSPTLDKKIGQMILLGFHGTKIEDPEVKTITKLAKQGKIGGVILFAYNITSPTQVKKLNDHFKSLGLLIAADQEGGKVQRLSSKNGFKDFKSAKDLAKGTPDQALTHYRDMAKTVKDAGFNVAFGPVVDLHSDQSPVIGMIKRAFHKEPKPVCEYAASFVKAFHEEGVITCIKHFPGHGLALKDSHKGWVDITKTFQDKELEPFECLIQEGLADMIMSAHLVHTAHDKKYPVSLSEEYITPILRNRFNYNGVVITDDLHMGAIQQHFSLKEVVLQAVKAGNDILMFGNNSWAAGGVKDFKSDVLISEQIQHIIKEAIQTGEVSESQITDSYRRIVALKNRVH